MTHPTSTQPRPKAPTRLSWRAGSRGAVMVEYAFLLVAIAIPAMVGISAGGVGMLKKFNRTRTSIMQNSP